MIKQDGAWAKGISSGACSAAERTNGATSRSAASWLGRDAGAGAPARRLANADRLNKMRAVKKNNP